MAADAPEFAQTAASSPEDAAHRKPADNTCVDAGAVVLIVDDDVPLVESLSRRLRRLKVPWEIRYTGSPKEAFEAARDLADRDLVLVTDWMMPGQTGPDLATKLRAEREADEACDRSMYVLMLTGKSSVDDMVAALTGGADDYISKPFDARELSARISVGQRFVGLMKEVRQAKQRLAAEARTDELTKLPNRRHGSEQLDIELTRCARLGTELSVALFDIDHFKSINDTYGHEAGDDVLREVARRLRDACRPYDLIARWGGEEFLLIAPGIGPGDILEMCDRIRLRIASDPVTLQDGNELGVTTSGGCVSVPPGTHCPASILLGNADRGLYQAKENGRNRVCRAEDES